MSESAALGDMTVEQVQVVAFHQIRMWLDLLGV
jgi:hypothetical protein